MKAMTKGTGADISEVEGPGLSDCLGAQVRERKGGLWRLGFLKWERA